MISTHGKIKKRKICKSSIQPNLGKSIMQMDKIWRGGEGGSVCVWSGATCTDGYGQRWAGVAPPGDAPLVGGKNQPTCGLLGKWLLTVKCETPSLVLGGEYLTRARRAWPSLSPFASQLVYPRFFLRIKSNWKKKSIFFSFFSRQNMERLYKFRKLVNRYM